VVGTLAYLANYSSGLQIIDVSNPTVPVEVGLYDIPGDAMAVQVAGDVAYVADWDGGLQIIDVSSPGSPVLRGHFDSPGPVRDVQVVGTLAYVADAVFGLRIVDVSDPAAPVELGFCETPGGADAVYLADSLAYVACEEHGLHVIDVSDPANPVRLGSHDTSKRAIGVTVSGELAFVAGRAEGLQVFKLTEPTAGVTGVTKMDDTTYRIDMADPLVEGTYRLRIGPDIVDLAGKMMDQDTDGTGGELPEDSYKFEVVIDTTPPPAPLELTLVSDTGSADNITAATVLEFTWSAPADIAGIGSYKYRLDGGTWTLTADPSGVVVTTEGLHTFEVRAIDGASNVGPATSLDVVVDMIAPEAPAGLRLDGAVLRWDAAADANGIWKYQYRPSGGAWADAADGSAATGLADGATSSFDVRAVDKAANVGPWSSATLTADYGPSIISHSPGGLVAGPIDHIDVTFNEPIAPSTFTAEDVRIVASAPQRLGGYDTDGSAYSVAVSGTTAYVADYDKGLKIIDVSNPVAPILLGSYAITGNALDVAVSGNVAFVAYGSDGMHILDVSDPAEPILVGSYADETVFGVEVSGALAYAMDHDGNLSVVDISNPSSPVRLGGCAVNGIGYDIALSGATVYVASKSDVYIIDVSNPGAPYVLGVYDAPNYVYSVAVSGDNAYVAEQTNGLRVLDVSNPVVPVPVGVCKPNIANRAYGVAVNGTLAYLAMGTDGFATIDVSDPNAPFAVDTFDTSGDARGLALSGNKVYVADREGGLQIVEVPWAEVTGVTQVDQVTYRIELANSLGSGSYHVTIEPGVTDQAGNTMDQDGNGVVAETPDDVYAFGFDVDATDPQAPAGLALTNDTGSVDNVTSATTPAFEWSASSDANGIVGYEYLLDGGAWVPTAALSASVPAGEGPHTFEVRAVDGLGNAGYVAALDLVVDTTAPAAPTGFGLDGALLVCDEVFDANGLWMYQFRIDGGGEWIDSPIPEAPTGLAEGVSATFEARAVDKAGNAGAVAAATMTVDYGPRVISHSPDGLTGEVNSLTITFDEPIDPASLTAEDVQVALHVPVKVAEWSMAFSAMAQSGNLLYAANEDDGLMILDVSDPAAPVVLGVCDTPGRPRDVVVVDYLAYVADSHEGIQIIDVWNPAVPVLIGSCDVLGHAHDVAISGNLVFTGDYSNGMKVIDVSDPAAPVLVGAHVGAGATYDVAASGTLAYLATGTYIDVVDVSNPAAPVLLSRLDLSESVREIALEGDLLYVANHWNGLAVVDVSDPAAPTVLGREVNGFLMSLALSGTVAYGRDHSGLEVYDVHDPAAPVLLGRSPADTGDYAGLAILGERAFIHCSWLSMVFQLFEPMAGISGITQLDEMTYRIDLATPLADGRYDLRIGPDVTDLAGNSMDQNGDGVGGTMSSDVFAFGVISDLTPPSAADDVTLTSDTGSPDGVTTATALTFSWSPATDANTLAGYEYRLDGCAWTWTTELIGQATAAEGPHMFEVRAVDGVGNAGPTAALDVAVDLTAPRSADGLQAGRLGSALGRARRRQRRLEVRVPPRWRRAGDDHRPRGTHGPGRGRAGIVRGPRN